VKTDCQINPDKLTRSLMRMDSSIRSGQFLNAYREANKLLAEFSRGEYATEDDGNGSIEASIKRTILFLQPLIKAYSQNQATLDIVRRISRCRKSQ